ncbi:hypothetical protein [Microbacterium lacticum]
MIGTDTAAFVRLGGIMAEEENVNWVEFAYTNFGWVIGLVLLLVIGGLVLSWATRSRRSARDRKNDAAASVYWGSGGAGSGL